MDTIEKKPVDERIAWYAYQSYRVLRWIALFLMIQVAILAWLTYKLVG